MKLTVRNLPRWPDYAVNSVFYIDNKNQNTCASALSKDGQHEKTAKPVPARGMIQRIKRLTSQRITIEEAANKPLGDIEFDVERYKHNRELFRSLKESVSVLSAISEGLAKHVVEINEQSKEANKLWNDMQNRVNDIKRSMEEDGEIKKETSNTDENTAPQQNVQTAEKAVQKLILPPINARQAKKNILSKQQKKGANLKSEDSDRPNSLPSVFKNPKDADADLGDTKQPKTKSAKVSNDKVTNRATPEVQTRRKKKPLPAASQNKKFANTKSTIPGARKSSAISSVDSFDGTSDESEVNSNIVIPVSNAKSGGKFKHFSRNAGKVVQKPTSAEKYRKHLQAERKRANLERRLREMEGCIIKPDGANNVKVTDTKIDSMPSNMGQKRKN